MIQIPNVNTVNSIKLEDNDSNYTPSKLEQKISIKHGVWIAQMTFQNDQNHNELWQINGRVMKFRSPGIYRDQRWSLTMAADIIGVARTETIDRDLFPDLAEKNILNISNTLYIFDDST